MEVMDFHAASPGSPTANNHAATETTPLQLIVAGTALSRERSGWSPTLLQETPQRSWCQDPGLLAWSAARGHPTGRGQQQRLLPWLPRSGDPRPWPCEALAAAATRSKNEAQPPGAHPGQTQVGDSDSDRSLFLLPAGSGSRVPVRRQLTWATWMGGRGGGSSTPGLGCLFSLAACSSEGCNRGARGAKKGLTFLSPMNAARSWTHFRFQALSGTFISR